MDAKHSVLTAGRRELTKAQNRETILLAARQVFSELGFAAATVRDIVRATPMKREACPASRCWSLPPASWRKCTSG